MQTVSLLNFHNLNDWFRTIFISSESDLSEQTIFDAFFSTHPDLDTLESLIQQNIIKALDWLQKKSIEVSKIGSICNILNYTNGIRLKDELNVRLIYCLGFSLTPNIQNEFAIQVCLALVQLSHNINILIFYHQLASI